MKKKNKSLGDGIYPLKSYTIQRDRYGKMVQNEPVCPFFSLFFILSNNSHFIYRIEEPLFIIIS